MKFQQLLQGLEVIKVNGVNGDRDIGEALGAATPSPVFFSQRFVTKINLNVTSREKSKESKLRSLWQLYGVASLF